MNDFAILVTIRSSSTSFNRIVAILAQYCGYHRRYTYFKPNAKLFDAFPRVTAGCTVARQRTYVFFTFSKKRQPIDFGTSKNSTPYQIVLASNPVRTTSVKVLRLYQKAVAHYDFLCCIAIEGELIDNPRNEIGRTNEMLIPRMAAQFIIYICMVFDVLIYRILTNYSKEYSTNLEDRSDSDNGRYLIAVRGALRSHARFRYFKRHPFYKSVLEHVSKDQGKEYLKIILEENPSFIEEKLDIFSKLDELGSPKKYIYDQFGKISPTTLRYLKVASDLRKYFGDNLGKEITEIGCGYGGQLLVLDQLFCIDRYTMFDLLPVCELISQYVDTNILNSSYRTTTINQFTPQDFDLVISNYAFSELPLKLQMTYFRKVLSRAKKGYLTMNSGRGTTGSSDRLSLVELQNMIPDLEILEERPLTGPNNYIVIWGA